MNCRGRSAADGRWHPAAARRTKGLANASTMQQNQRKAQCEQQQIASGGDAAWSFGATLKEHQRAHRPWHGDMTAQQMHEDRHAQRRQTAEKPWSKKAHQLPACRSAEIFAQRHIERLIGHQQVIIHARCRVRESASLRCARRSWRDTPSSRIRGSLPSYGPFPDRRGPTNPSSPVESPADRECETDTTSLPWKRSGAMV